MSDRISKLLAHQGTPPVKSTLGAVLFLAWPAIVEQIMITLVQYVDTAMVGSLGSQATAAVGLTASTTWLFNGFFAAAAIGFSVQVAQHLGAGRGEDARRVVWQSLRFTVLFGILMGAVGFALSFPLPALLGAEPAVRGGRLPVLPDHGLRHALHPGHQHVQRRHPLRRGYQDPHGPQPDDQCVQCDSQHPVYLPHPPGGGAGIALHHVGRGGGV